LDHNFGSPFASNRRGIHQFQSGKLAFNVRIADKAPGTQSLTSPKPVSGPRGSAEELKDYFRIADHPYP